MGNWDDDRIVNNHLAAHDNPLVRRVAERLHRNDSYHLHDLTPGPTCVYCAIRATHCVTEIADALFMTPRSVPEILTETLCRGIDEQVEHYRRLHAERTGQFPSGRGGMVAPVDELLEASRAMLDRRIAATPAEITVKTELLREALNDTTAVRALEELHQSLGRIDLTPHSDLVTQWMVTAGQVETVRLRVVEMLRHLRSPERLSR